MKKFTQNDIFINTLKVYPKVNIFTYSGSMYYNMGISGSAVQINDFLMEPKTPTITAELDFTLLLLEQFEPSAGWDNP